MEDVSIQQQIAELRTLSVPTLVARYEAVWGKPPRVKNKAWLWKRIAWKLQEQRYGGLSEVAKRRLEELISEIKLPEAEARRTVSGKLARPAKPGTPTVGSTLVREWRDRQIEVRVLEEGFEWNGVVYKSLSAAAEAVTGAHWNGRLFFGLAKRSSR